MSEAIGKFTTTNPFGRPQVTPVDLEDATPEQRKALKVTPSKTKVSEDVVGLAQAPEPLLYRTPLFNGVMYNRDGLTWAQPALEAAGASMINRCLYWAAVLLSRDNQRIKTEGSQKRSSSMAKTPG